MNRSVFARMGRKMLLPFVLAGVLLAVGAGVVTAQQVLPYDAGGYVMVPAGWASQYHQHCAVGSQGILFPTGVCPVAPRVRPALPALDPIFGFPSRPVMQPFVSGPPVGTVVYPYYTVRGPRDFLLSNPPPLGP